MIKRSFIKNTGIIIDLFNEDIQIFLNDAVLLSLRLLPDKSVILFFEWTAYPIFWQLPMVSYTFLVQQSSKLEGSI